MPFEAAACLSLGNKVLISKPFSPSGPVLNEADRDSVPAG